MPRYILFVENGLQRDERYNDYIISDEPLNDEELQELAEANFWSHLSFGWEEVEEEED
jgi:hypothetical protein